MRLVKLLPRWLTPRVESEPYDPPQDDPPQGDVAENGAGRPATPNATVIDAFIELGLTFPKN
jgi:hypothetical protein